MGRLFEGALGSSYVEIAGSRPERALNVFAARGIPFRSARMTEDGTLTAACLKYREKALVAAAEDCGLTARVVKRRGALVFAARFKRRLALLSAAAVAVLAAFYFSLGIWEVRVEGNVTVPSGEIISALSESGFGVGCFGPTADREYASSYIRMKVGSLSWVGINIKGCVMTVIVRERRSPPAILNAGPPCDIAALKTGVVVSVDDFAGQGLVEAGDTVLKGQKLISGEVAGISGETRLVHSCGSVRARTWYVLSACAPLEYGAKIYTGAENRKTALLLGDLRVNLYINSRIFDRDCDNILFDGRAELFGAPLPLSERGTISAAYDTEPARTPDFEAETMLKTDLASRLRDMLRDGEVVSELFEAFSDGSSVTVVLRAECVEEIAGEVPLIQTREEEPDT